MNKNKLDLLMLIAEGQVYKDDTLRAIGKKIDNCFPASIKHHLSSLMVCGFAKIHKDKIVLTKDGEELVNMIVNNKKLIEKLFKLAGNPGKKLI